MIHVTYDIEDLRGEAVQFFNLPDCILCDAVERGFKINE